jgi:hypothetical protein
MPADEHARKTAAREILHHHREKEGNSNGKNSYDCHTDCACHENFSPMLAEEEEADSSLDALRLKKRTWSLMIVGIKNPTHDQLWYSVAKTASCVCQLHSGTSNKRS